MWKQFTENTEKVFVKLGRVVISNRRNGGCTEVPSVKGNSNDEVLTGTGRVTRGEPAKGCLA